MTDTVEMAVKETCAFFGMKEAELCGHCTSDFLCLARYMCWYYLHCDRKVLMREIEDRFHRKRDTIHKGIAKMRNLLTFKPYASTYEAFIKHITKQEREQ